MQSLTGSLSQVLAENLSHHFIAPNVFALFEKIQVLLSCSTLTSLYELIDIKTET